MNGVQRIASVVLVAAIAGAGSAARQLDRQRQQAPREETFYLQSPRLVKVLSLGYTGLAADVYWTRAVQYFGWRHLHRSRDYPLLYPLLDLAANLDPHLTTVYEFGSFFLAQTPPQGAGLPDVAVTFVERGIRANPEAWRLYYHLGFIHAIERKDYGAAAAAFERGAAVPGALQWMKVMAAVMRSRGGDRDAARFLWMKIYEDSTDKHVRENALVRLLALRIDREVTGLQMVVDAYTRRAGHIPAGWQELVAAGALRAVPLDPTGDVYRLVAGQVVVQHPQKFPFITEGLNGAEAPTRITPETYRPL